MAEYIKREEAYEDFEKCNSENPKWTPSRVKTLIARQKAADVDPVRHGRWICVDTDTEQFFLCNRCKKKEYWESNYCPNCGCKMDLEEAKNAKQT